ncbi:hypothetical protein [Escherichia phage BYEP02]|nr:hypothetical protein [Escherichia phage BYEP02]
MNYINFERKYVSNGIAGSIDTICLWKHQKLTLNVNMFLMVLQVLLIPSAFGNIKMDQYAKLNSI